MPWRAITAAERCGEAGGIGDRPARHDEALEIVVIVLGLEIVMRRTRGEIVLGRGGEAQQHGGATPRHAARARMRTPGRSRAASARFGRGERRRPSTQIGLVEDDEIGRGELIAEHLLERIVVASSSRRAASASALAAAAQRASITATTPSTVTRALISGQ